MTFQFAHLVDDAAGEAQPVEGIAAHPLRYFAEARLEAPGARTRGPEVQKEEASPLGDRAGVEREVLGPQGRILIEKRRSDELAVERVRPGVIRTPDGAGARRRRAASRGVRLAGRAAFVRRAEAGAPVTADVVVRREPALARPREQQAFAQDLEHAHFPGLREVFGASGTDPLAREDPIALFLEDLGRGVVLGGKGLFEHYYELKVES